MAAIDLGGKRPERKKMRRRRRFTASRYDSFSVEEEDNEVELPAVLARAGVAGVDDGVLGSHGGGGRQWFDLGLGFDPESGEEWYGEREREQVRVVVVFFLQGSR